MINIFWFGNLDTRNLDTSVFEATACSQPSTLIPSCLPLPLEKNNHCKCCTCISLSNLLHAYVTSNTELIHDQTSDFLYEIFSNRQFHGRLHSWQTFPRIQCICCYTGWGCIHIWNDQHHFHHVVIKSFCFFVLHWYTCFFLSTQTSYYLDINGIQ